MRNITDKSCRENQDIHFIFNNFFLKKSRHLWDNVENYGRDRAATDDSIIQSMRLAFWITKATDTHLDYVVVASWIVMAHARTPNLVFRRNERVHLNRRGRQFSRLLVAEVCASAVVMLDTPCSEVVWRVLATHSIRQFPLHFPSCASPCVIEFQLESNSGYSWSRNLIHFVTVLLISKWRRTWRFGEVGPPRGKVQQFLRMLQQGTKVLKKSVQF